MSNPNPFTIYASELQKNLAAGAASEHTHRPALKTLLESLAAGVMATNEPKRVECGAPDFSVARDRMTLGYVETKDIGKSLDEAEGSEQLRRYRRSLDNLILTDYLEFRWYVDGEPRAAARLARAGQGGKLIRDKAGRQAVEALLGDFLSRRPEPVTTPKELAERMARLAHLIRDIIINAFEREGASPTLGGWLEAFRKTLVSDLEPPQFADMFAQTIAYGLFSARAMDITPGFSRQEAQSLIPKTNPFLRKFFYQITGPDLDDEPFAGFVDDLVGLLGLADMEAILSDFGKRTKQEDPVVHFYETFLAAYDPALRASRGVYYTPEPVVSYIVRSVDHILKTTFNLPAGLSDTTKITVPNRDTSRRVGGKEKQVRKTDSVHKVLILDPAAGTGTFLYSVIDLIRERFTRAGNAGMWPGYVREHLLPRLFGFELLMAPYAVAHLKLGLQLAGHDLTPAQRDKWAYDFASDERLRVYLTNTLQEAHEMADLPLFTQWLAEEASSADEVKTQLPIMVVLGNPPYSGHSANKGKWIGDLLRGRLPDGDLLRSRLPDGGKLRGKLPDGGKTANYYEVDGGPLGERNPKWLQDDYVKFIRFGQWRIEETGAGVLAFVTNHGYLDNPTFRGMRQSLMETFTDIYVLDLHGNTKKREVCPDGSKDENVFDIQQGVAIGIFVKEPGKNGAARVHHGDVWGVRDAKYKQLFETDVKITDWKQLEPQSSIYLFVPQDVDLLNEYNKGWRMPDAFPVNSVGIVTARDKLTVRWSADEVWKTVQDFADLPPETAREKYSLRKDARDWKVHLAQEDLRASGPEYDKVVPVLYRPFDVRFTYYTGRSRGFICMPRPEVMRHMMRKNVALLCKRQSKRSPFSYIWTCNEIAESSIFESAYANNSVLPLYLYPDAGEQYGRAAAIEHARKVIKDSGRVEAKNVNTEQDRIAVSIMHLFPNESYPRWPNLHPYLIADVEKCLGLSFIPDSKGDLQTTFGPEDVFHYIYAILHSPTYRERYAGFLKIDFPRVPLTSDRDLFRALAGLGGELVALHLMESPQLNDLVTRFPVAGDNVVGKVRYVGPRRIGETTEVSEDLGGLAPGRVYINKTQYFEGIEPAVWQFQIGGYQVLHKWLKDRKGRRLSFDDLFHYQKIVVALKETMRLMEEIDSLIPSWPLE